MLTTIMADSPLRSGRPTWLEIDPQRVVDNFLLAKKQVGDSVGVFPVVKADCYGLGALPISRALLAAGAPGLCVGLLEEGEELRQGGVTAPIVLFAGLTAGSEQQIIDLNLQPFLYDLERAKELNRAALAANKMVTCYIKIDTGMGRIGFSTDGFYAAIKELYALSGLNIAGVVSHLACGDEDEKGEVTSSQISKMQSLLASVEVGSFNSLANSAGTLYHPSSHLQWVRPGIMLYGASPAYPRRSFLQDGLVPVVRWLSRIIQVAEFAKGTPLGYGHSFITKKPSKIAQIPVGYGDGYSRQLSNKRYVLIAGKKAPIVGRVCMDLTAVDITDIPDVKTGDLVTLLGGDGGEFISIETMADWLETIPYEVICRLGKRLPRYYSRNGS
jgi:alanine racemase